MTFPVDVQLLSRDRLAVARDRDAKELGSSSVPFQAPLLYVNHGVYLLPRVVFDEAPFTGFSLELPFPGGARHEHVPSSARDTHQMGTQLSEVPPVGGACSTWKP